MLFRKIGAEAAAYGIANDIRHRGNAIVAEDLEEFEQKRNAGCNEDNCRDGPEDCSSIQSCKRYPKIMNQPILSMISTSIFMVSEKS